MDGYLWGVVGFLTAAALRGIMSLIKMKWGIKDKDRESIDDMKKRCDERHKEIDERLVAVDKALCLQNEANSVILTSLYALLVTAERSAPNGEIKAAKEAFTATFKQNFCIKVEDK